MAALSWRNALFLTRRCSSVVTSENARLRHGDSTSSGCNDVSGKRNVMFTCMLDFPGQQFVKYRLKKMWAYPNKFRFLSNIITCVQKLPSLILHHKIHLNCPRTNAHFLVFKVNFFFHRSDFASLATLEPLSVPEFLPQTAVIPVCLLSSRSVSPTRESSSAYSPKIWIFKGSILVKFSREDVTTEMCIYSPLINENSTRNLILRFFFTFLNTDSDSIQKWDLDPDWNWSQSSRNGNSFCTVQCWDRVWSLNPKRYLSPCPAM